MGDKSLTMEITGSGSSVLDHASEFAELLMEQAPGEYRRLLASGRFRDELARESVFNHGKLYAYAEFSVFRREFLRRFGDDAAAACITAFSSLFLKNDISIANLVDFVEGTDDCNQLLLNQPD